MSDKIVEVTEKVKNNVTGVDVQVTIGDFTTIREVVEINGKWFAVNPFVLAGGSKEFPSKEAAIAAASNLEI